MVAIIIWTQTQVVFEKTGIKRITEKGVELVDGQLVELDVLICATGFDTSLMYPFPVIGRNGVKLQDRWSPDPESYLAVCVDGFPNYFFSAGPNAAVGTNSIILVIEKQVDYAVKAVEKLQREHLKSIEVKPKAVRDFSNYRDVSIPSIFTMPSNANARCRPTSLRYANMSAELYLGANEIVQTYFTDKIATWYKNGKVDGKVTCIWPGV